MKLQIYRINEYICSIMKGYVLIISILLAFLQSAGLRAEERKIIKGFSGGMMVHAGYVFGADCPAVPDLKISDATFGLGGVAKVHFTENLRVGFEGYFSNANLHRQMESGSHSKVFWVGALADWYWKKGKLYPFAGLTVGGGQETSFYMFEGNKHDWLPEANVIFRKQPFLAIDPHIGTEYAVGKALHLILKADWLIAINSDGLNRPHGPRLYFGIIFSH